MVRGALRGRLTMRAVEDLMAGAGAGMERPEGRLAQLVERHVYTVDVGSSSLSPPTRTY